MAKKRKIKVATYNSYSNSAVVKILTNPLFQVVLIVAFFFILQISGVIEFLKAGLFSR